MGRGIMPLKIPVSGAIIMEEEVNNIIDVAKGKWFTHGKYCTKFEKQLSEFIGVRHTHLVNSGSSASLLAISALCSEKLGDKRLKKGDEVITTALAFPTTVNPIIQNGLIPVFVDIDIPTYNVNVKAIENAITDKTRAIVLAHTLGNPFNIAEVARIAQVYGLFLIEDCCDALGSLYSGNHVGVFGDIGTLSFFPAHQITTGEGGAVFTNNPLLSKIMVSLRDWGRDCTCLPGQNNVCGQRFTRDYEELPHGFDHKYVFSEMGYNLKMTEMQAAIGVAQMQKLSLFTKIRQYNFGYLTRRLNKIFELILPETSKLSSPSWFGYPISVSENRNKLISYLYENDIDTRMLFAGNITKQPYFKNLEYRISGELTNTDYAMNNSFWIGLYPQITEKMMDYQIEKIRDFYGGNNTMKRNVTQAKELCEIKN